MKLLLYCTKAKPYLVKRNIFAGVEPSYFTLKENVDDSLNGKIVAECDFEIEKIMPINVSEDDYDYGLYSGKDLLKESCLSDYDIYEYLRDDDGEIFNKGYAIHIKNLNIFDKPKKITAYHCKTNKNDELCLNGGCGYKFFYKAPQNMMKVYDHWGKGNDYILISVRPEWLCKILNGEKTIEIRKKVLREMIK